MKNPRTVKDYLKRASSDAQKRVEIYNPDTEDFECWYDGQKYITPSLEITQYKKHIANHIVTHLSNHLLNKRGVKTNVEDELKEIRQEILV